MFKWMCFCYAVVMWILLHWLRLMEIEIVFSEDSQPKRKIILRQFREVLNLYMAVKTFVALLRRPSGPSWSVVSFKRSSEDAQNNSIYFGNSLFGKQPETNPHLTPVITSLCKYQDAFCVLVACQVMETFRHIYCSCTGCRKNQLTLEATCYKHRVSGSLLRHSVHVQLCSNELYLKHII